MLSLKEIGRETFERVNVKIVVVAVVAAVAVVVATVAVIFS